MSVSSSFYKLVPWSRRVIPTAFWDIFYMNYPSKFITSMVSDLNEKPLKSSWSAVASSSTYTFTSFCPKCCLRYMYAFVSYLHLLKAGHALATSVNLQVRLYDTHYV